MRGEAESVLRVGNLAALRDFLDVRDVVEAYAMAALGAELPEGPAMNVSTGRPAAIGDIVGRLRALARVEVEVEVEVEVDPARLRKRDLPCASGDPGRAARLLGWAPRILLERILTDLLDHLRARAESRDRPRRHMA